MGIPLYMEDFEPAIKEITDKLKEAENYMVGLDTKLNKILQYNANFDEEVFASLSRIEQTINDLKNYHNQPIPAQPKQNKKVK